jgi:hypothetical protein
MKTAASRRRGRGSPAAESRGGVGLPASWLLRLSVAITSLHACMPAGMVRAQVAPSAHNERITCSIAAAIKYAVPANLVLAVAEIEGGKPGQWVLNRNGSFDVGALQLNTSYLRDLARYGITPEDVAAAGCYAYELATWRLARHLARDHGDLWQRAANYHSRTAALNAKYRRKLMACGARWAHWLKARYATREFDTPMPPEQSPPLMAASARGRSGDATVLAERVLTRRAAKARGARAAVLGARTASVPLRPAWVQNRDVHVTPVELQALHPGITSEPKRVSR